MAGMNGTPTSAAGCNLRELGASRLYRSDAPAGLSVEVRRAFDSLGLTTVVDLRTEGERVRLPCDLASDPRIDYRAVDLNAGLGGRDGSAWDGTGITSLDQLYVAFLDRCAAELAAVVRILMEADGPALFHCAAGKDRTGVVAMLVLGLLGAGDGAILDDYLATKAALAPLMPQLASAPDIQAAGPAGLAFLDTKPEFLQAALNRVHAAGGFAAYAADSLGLTPEEIAAFRRRRPAGLGV